MLFKIMQHLFEVFNMIFLRFVAQKLTGNITKSEVDTKQQREQA